jgi:hypothetical protein
LCRKKPDIFAAAKSGDRELVLDHLIADAACAKRRLQRMNACTPLHTFVRCGQFATSQLLLQSCADVNAESARNMTPLHVSCEEKLLQAKAGIEAKPRRSAHLCIAAAGDNIECADCCSSATLMST